MNKNFHIFLFFLFVSIAISELQLGFRLKNHNYNQDIIFDENDYIGNGLYSWLKMDFGNMQYVNEMCMSNNPEHMARGRGKKVKGIYGFSNQGYIAVQKKSMKLNNEFIFGRAYINHGFSDFSSLLISKWSRPFDQIGWKASYKGISGQIYGAQLDPIMNINRYLSIHTIDFNLLENITISFGESSLYAGENRGIELQYFNPTLFWIPVRENQPLNNQANGFLFSGARYLKGNAKIWVEYLLDDYQIDKEVKEPTTYGLLLGVSLERSKKIIEKMYLEYSRVSNRTYQTAGEYGQENYLHRNFSIGHHLGNDFESVFFYVDFIERSISNFNYKPQLKLAFLRDGSEGIDTPWDTPWDNYENLDIESFSEEFPTKPITTVFEGIFSTKLSLKQNSFIDLGVFLSRKIFNGKKKNGLSICFSLLANV